jgi:tetratricopeptide (TPR) repeat protein
MARLALLALLTGAFALATALQPRFGAWSQRKPTSQSILASLMGDSRRLFANHFFIKSDVYLHKGYYPTIFDRPDDGQKGGGKLHVAEHASGHDHDEHDDHDEHGLVGFLGQPRNWIDAFGRNFFPSQHHHLGEDAAGATEAREILPWIKLSAELDPQRIESYTVGAYWLRTMSKTNEAFQFLREGLRANPNSHEILFELGACYEERTQTALARNLWELALRRWQEQQVGQEHPDYLTLAQILTRLARLEVRENHRDQAVKYLEIYKKVAPAPDQVQKRIEEVKAGLPFEAETK